MKPGLTPGMFAEVGVVVTAAMCPHFDGVLVHPVLATWYVVHHMELAGRKLLEPYLEFAEEAVGAHIRVDHRSPAPVGSHVRVVAEALECRPHRLVCATRALCGTRVVAEGEFVQIIMPKTRLHDLFERHRPGLEGG
ncbi:MAG: thioesterase [Phycisphaerae bacterium]